MNVRHEEANMSAALKEVAKTREKMKALRLRSQHDIERRRERAAILAATGGSPGEKWRKLYPESHKADQERDR